MGGREQDRDRHEAITDGGPEVFDNEILGHPADLSGVHLKVSFTTHP